MTAVFDVHEHISLGDPLEVKNFDRRNIPGDGVVEAGECTSEKLVSYGQDPRMNHLFRAVQLAYNEHYPLALSPDHIWHTITMGFANHVKENAEALRSRFVKHEGKKEIHVDTPGVKGSTATPWASKPNPAGKFAARFKHQCEVMDCNDDPVLDKFTDALRGELGDGLYNIFMKEFSTTNHIARASMAVSMLDTFQEYFTYICHTRCGIPFITLEGKTEDWEQIRERAEVLGEYDLQWWTKHLLPVLDQFVAASKGDVDQYFWQTIYDENSRSGGDTVTGWLLALFPYLKQGQKRVRNEYLNWERHNSWNAPGTSDFLPSLSVAPFIWDYYGTHYKMEFVGGIIGFSQDPDSLMLRPEMAWGVREV